jgi:hypothetical protein
MDVARAKTVNRQQVQILYTFIARQLCRRLFEVQ